MVQLHNENTILKEQLASVIKPLKKEIARVKKALADAEKKQAKDDVLRAAQKEYDRVMEPVTDLQDRIDENDIAIHQLSVDIDISLDAVLAAKRQETPDAPGDEHYNIATFLDAMIDKAINGAFEFAIWAATDPGAAYDLDDDALVSMCEGDMADKILEYREALAWIEDEDNAMHMPEWKTSKRSGKSIFCGAFTFNTACLAIGADCNSMRLAVFSLRDMAADKIRDLLCQYNSAAYRRQVEEEAAERRALVNWIPAGPSDDDLDTIAELEGELV
jgi:hypothetical protein